VTVLDAGSQPVVIAHRGASGHRPEHSAAAYRLALALGADAVEPDVVPTRDGVLVVRHENEISGTTDVQERREFASRRRSKVIDGRRVDGWFTEDFTWEELRTLRVRERLPALRPASARHDGREPPLRLADVVLLARSPGARGAQVVCELKHPTYFAGQGLPLAELLERELSVAGSRPDPTWLTVECFEKSALGAVAERGIDSRRVYLAESTGAAPDLAAGPGPTAPTYTEELSPAGLATLAGQRVLTSLGEEPLLHGISVHKSRLLDAPQDGARLVDDAHGHGLSVWCWTFRPENRFLAGPYRVGPENAWGRWDEEYRALAAVGVDGVFVDHPDLARRALR
jgi:glycerophosphoryl diester phosphodiesterase